MARGVVLDLISAILIFQAHVYAYFLSPYTDVFHTRQQMLESLGIFAFVLNIVVIYRYLMNQSLTTKESCANAEPLKTMDQATQCDTDTEVGAISDIDAKIAWNNYARDRIAHQATKGGSETEKYIFPENVGDNDIYQGDKQNVSLTNIAALIGHMRSIEIHQETFKEPIKTFSDSIDFPSSDDVSRRSLSLSWSLKIAEVCKSFADWSADVITVYVGIVCLYEVLQYRMLYQWSYQGLDLLELLIIPVSVIFTEVSFCVAQILHRILQHETLCEEESCTDLIEV